MALAFDAIASGAISDPGPLTFTSGATGSLTNGVAFVVVYHGAQVLTGVTWNSVAMTRITNGSEADVWMLANPPSGAQSVSISYTGSGTVIAYAMTYGGGSPNLVADNATETSSVAGVGTVTQALTPVADGCWTVLLVFSGSIESDYSASTGTTKRGSSVNGVGTTLSIGDSNAAITPPASYSMSMTRDAGGTGTVGSLIFSIAPYIAPPEAPLFTQTLYLHTAAFQRTLLNLTTTLRDAALPLWQSLEKSVAAWFNEDKS